MLKHLTAFCAAILAISCHQSPVSLIASHSLNKTAGTVISQIRFDMDSGRNFARLPVAGGVGSIGDGSDEQLSLC